MNSRDEHNEAVGFAGQHIENELLPLILAAKDKVDETVGMVANAVGGNPNAESGQNALGAIAGLTEKLEECANACHLAIAELNRYGGGF